MVLLAREAGKTRAAAIGEVREAADFCRYYAASARQHFATARALPSPTGESNELALHGRGAFVCISPWNFPLAIFTGQIAAALAAGNAAIAKPAEQTPLVAYRAVELLLAAGVPADVLAFLPAAARSSAQPSSPTRAPRVSSSPARRTWRGRSTARSRSAKCWCPIYRRDRRPERDDRRQLGVARADRRRRACLGVRQRRSALLRLARALVQDEVATRVIQLLQGAMDELSVGNPALLTTDVGPVIDVPARGALEAHVAAMASAGRVRHRAALPGACQNGTFIAPTLIELDRIDRVEREVFGPVLHIVRYRADALDAVVDSINATGYGLTLGIHSRIDETVRRIVSRARVGNVYVNRNMIGAVVGVQPFGGEGLSGTGPKAGGPHYLLRFAVERTLSINTAAAGGNAALLAQGDG